MLQNIEPVELDINITKVFQKLKKAEVDGFTTVVDRGGARSSKSHSLCQLFIERLVGPYPRKILICRKTLPSLRVSTLDLFETILDRDYGLTNRITVNRGVMNWKYGDSLLHFGGLDDPEKIKSSEWNDIWMEEATDFTYADYVALKLRQSAPTAGGPPNQIHLSFNPIDEYHWIKTRLIDKGERGLIELVSTFKDNPYLPPSYLQLIKQLAVQDKNYWRIYGLGEWGKLENLIYDNFDIVSEPNPDANIFYGLDFGFNAPTAVCRMHLDNYDLWVEPLIYESGLTNNQLIEKLRAVIPTEDRSRYPIYADSQEPNRIEEIRLSGFWIEKAIKSVKDGIDFCKRLNIHIVETDVSDYYKKEIQGYSWRTDKNDKVLEEPVKFNDHFMDATRYGAYTYHEEMIGAPMIRSL